MSQPIVPPTPWEMIRAVYTNRDLLLEEIAAWVLFLSGVLMGANGEQLIGLVLMASGACLTYHAHRRAFRVLVEEQQREKEAL